MKKKMKITDINGNKIELIFDPLMYNKLITPKYLHDDNLNFINNKTTCVMTHFCLN